MSATTINLKIYDPQESWIDQVREIQVARLGCHERSEYESLGTCKGVFTLFKDTRNYLVLSGIGFSVITRFRYYLVSWEDRVTENSTKEAVRGSYPSLDEVDTFARERLSTHSPR